MMKLLQILPMAVLQIKPLACDAALGADAVLNLAAFIILMAVLEPLEVLRILPDDEIIGADAVLQIMPGDEALGAVGR